MADASDFSEVRRLARDLDRAATGIAPQLKGVVKRGAQNVKTQLNKEMRASRHFKGTAPAISYDVKAETDAVEAEIGPRKGEPGSLANIAYFGGSGWGNTQSGGSVPDPLLALQAEQPNFERYIDDILRGVL